MGGGLIQLASYSYYDVFLTRDPQITFFKVVYRRYSNFSMESMRQNFLHTPDFGTRNTCIISNNGDLIMDMYLIIKLPYVREFTQTNGEVDHITKFAWARKIGFAIVNLIEIEIGGKVIDRHYGEWLNIWNELVGKTYDRGLDLLIGNVDELYNFTNGKNEYTLYIPISFWFCRSSGLALPLVALLYSEVKVNLELNDLSICQLIAPSHYIEIENDMVTFEKYEYIEQNVNGQIAAGIFMNFDMLTRRLYYYKITKNQFQSKLLQPSEIISSPFNLRRTIFDIAESTTISKYFIYGNITGSFVMPQYSTTNNKIFPKVHVYNQIRNISLADCYLLVNYVFLDQNERIKFTDSRHDYLIEQVMFMNQQTLGNSNNKINVEVIQPSKLFAWVVQYAYLYNSGDFFNYTDNYKYFKNKQVGKSLIIDETILLGSEPRLSYRKSQYFNYVQPYQHFSKNPNEGINVYSFSLFPEEIYPSGTCNMSQIDNISFQISLNTQVSIMNPAQFRGYSLGFNILRIINGLGGVVFDR